DNLNRLASAVGTYGSLGFTYDGAGNRLTRVLGSATDTYAYASTSNRLNTVTGSGNVRSFTYLAAGQMSQDVRDASNTYNYAYNSSGRLSSAAFYGATVGSYLYNGLEQRVAKTTASTTTHYVFDRSGHLLEEADASGNPIREYVWLGDRPLAIVDHAGS